MFLPEFPTGCSSAVADIYICSQRSCKTHDVLFGTSYMAHNPMKRSVWQLLHDAKVMNCTISNCLLSAH